MNVIILSNTLHPLLYFLERIRTGAPLISSSKLSQDFPRSPIF